MKILNENMMKYLSFPDSDVKKINFSQKNKTLKFFIEGAWLDLEDGQELGKGFLSFEDWKNLTIRAYHSSIKKWENIDIKKIEHLNDICEIKFAPSSVSLAGFSKNCGLWTEWNIENAKMHAEFEEISSCIIMHDLQ
jgi:hypothetical protein